MKIDEFCKIHKRKIAIIAAVSVGILILVVAGIFFFAPGKEQEDSTEGQAEAAETQKDAQEVYQNEDVYTVQGVVEAVPHWEKFLLEGLEDGLLIEEVYVTDGEEMQKGDRILKFSEESVAAVREELEQVKLDTELAFREAEIEYEQSKITLQYDKEKAVLSGEYAQAVYDETVAELSGDVDKAQTALTEAKNQIKAYEKVINGKSSQAPFYVDKYKKIYDDNVKILTKKIDQYGFSWNEVVYGSGNETPSEQLAVLQQFYKILEQNLLDYEQAQADYENAVADAKLNLQTLELSLSSLEVELSEAKAAYDIEVLQAKRVMEQTKSDAENAQNDYVMKLNKLESDYNILKKGRDDAAKQLKAFEACVGNGYYYATQSGTILQTSLTPGQYLKHGTAMFEYSNQQELMVTVAVEQEAIASIAVGDAAYIKGIEEGSFQGTVVGIKIPLMPENGEVDGYDVTVALTGEQELLKAGQTVNVMFRIGGAADEEAN